MYMYVCTCVYLLRRLPFSLFLSFSLSSSLSLSLSLSLSRARARARALSLSIERERVSEHREREGEREFPWSKVSHTCLLCLAHCCAISPLGPPRRPLLSVSLLLSSKGALDGRRALKNLVKEVSVIPSPLSHARPLSSLLHPPVRPMPSAYLLFLAHAYVCFPLLLEPFFLQLCTRGLAPWRFSLRVRADALPHSPRPHGSLWATRSAAAAAAAVGAAAALTSPANPRLA